MKDIYLFTSSFICSLFICSLFKQLRRSLQIFRRIDAGLRGMAAAGDGDHVQSEFFCGASRTLTEIAEAHDKTRDALKTFLMDSATKAIDERLQRVSRTAKLKGFRPGKAPAEAVLRVYGESALLRAAAERGQSGAGAEEGAAFHSGEEWKRSPLAQPSSCRGPDAHIDGR